MDASGRVGTEMATDTAEASPAGQRGRDSLFMTARVTIAGMAGVHEARVRNLSAGGLMAELDRVVEAGTPVTLEMRGLGEIAGQIAWCTRGRLGIAFDQPIDPKRARKPVGRGVTTPDYAKSFVARVPRR